MNKVILMGRMVTDPENRQTQTGKTCTRFRIAVNRPGKDQQTDFFSCIAWGKTSEFISRNFHKGKPIMIDGRIQNNDYTDKSGTKHYSAEIIVENVEFCGDKAEAPTQVAYLSEGYPGYQTEPRGNVPQLGDRIPIEDYDPLIADASDPLF